LQEAGVPNHEVAFWMGGLVPVGTPREIIELLQAQFAKAMAAPDVKQRLAVLGFEPAASTSEQFAAHMRAESEIWKAVVRDANIKIE
jgi:tripartite-type tricarboxylate transporter receptor subunit TctC